jgi:hypothetical protein
VRDRAIAVIADVTMPSTPVRVMKCCMLGVRRNGTLSLELMRACPGAKPATVSLGPGLLWRWTMDSLGRISVMYIIPVLRLRWNRFGVRLLRQHTYVRKLIAAVWSANCLRMSQRLSGESIVLIMY